MAKIKFKKKATDMPDEFIINMMSFFITLILKNSSIEEVEGAIKDANLEDFMELVSEN